MISTEDFALLRRPNRPLTAAQRLERQLRHSDDPEAALALADLLEERGDMAEARRWRLYGEWHLALQAALDRGRWMTVEMCKARHWTQRIVDMGTFRVVFRPARIDVQVKPPRGGYVATCWTRTLTRRCIGRPRYVRDAAHQIVEHVLEAEANAVKLAVLSRE